VTIRMALVGGRKCTVLRHPALHLRRGTLVGEKIWRAFQFVEEGASLAFNTSAFSGYVGYDFGQDKALFGSVEYTSRA